MGQRYNSPDDLSQYSLTQSTNRQKNRDPQFPQAPDPAYLADQQMRINRDAARASLVNQEGPFGSLQYSENPDGTFTARSQLDPSEVDAVMGARAGANQGLMSYYQRYGGAGPDFSGERNKIEDAMYGRATSRLDPQYEQRERQLMTRLENQGITQGSRAYQEALDNFNQERRGAYDEARQSSILGGGAEQSRLFDMSSRQRAQEFGDIGGLFDLGRIARFTPQGQGNAGVGAPDFMGAAQNRWMGDVAGYNAQMANSSANRQANTQTLAAILSLFG